nr:helix-turn-helix transcriptional regulator [Lentilactobacillus otakiensis]
MFVTKQLIHFRKLNGLTQDDLANKIHVSRQTISHWETGKKLPGYPKSVVTLRCV